MKFLQKEMVPLQQAAIACAIVVVAAALFFSVQRPATGSQVAAALESVQESDAESQPVLKDYVEVISSCGPYHEGECLNIRTGPGTEYQAVSRIRTGAVLRVAETVQNDEGTWYRLTFDEWLRYPERQTGTWYIASEYVRPFTDIGAVVLNASTTPTKKRIIVDRGDQMLYAYDGETLFMEQLISTGLDLTPTPRGTFTIFRKTPSRYMQGPIPGISEKIYDLPGVPWNLYFTHEGAVLHGAYWHDHFGKQWSNGCVNLPLDKARELYFWADLGTTVTVRD